MKNNVTNEAVQFTPVLFMADGTEYDLPARTLAPSELVKINVNDALSKAPSEVAAHLSDHGSAAIRFTHSWDALTATVQNLDLIRSLIFRDCFANTTANATAKAASQTIEGLWWKHDDGTDAFVALANSGDSPLSVHLQASGPKGDAAGERQVSLSPHSTEFLQIADLLAGTAAAAPGREELAFHIGELNPICWCLQEWKMTRRASLPLCI